MNEFLQTIGSCSLVILVIFIIKKVDDYFYFKKYEKECENIHAKFDDNNDDL